MMLQKDSTSDIVLWYRLLNPKHTTDKAVIRSAYWSTNEHIFYIRAICHHKIESVTSNVSATANQLLTTLQTDTQTSLQWTVHRCTTDLNFILIPAFESCLVLNIKLYHGYVNSELIRSCLLYQSMNYLI